MSINDFFTTNFTIRRLIWDTDNQGNRFSGEQEVGQFMGHIQQADALLAQNLGFSLTKTFSVWCSCDTDVIEGDKLATDDAHYTVRAKIDNKFVGDNKHIELIVEKGEETQSGS